MQSLPPALAPLGTFKAFIIVKLTPGAKPGKRDKLPVDYRTGLVTPAGSGGAHNPAIWMHFGAASTLAACMGPGYGVGFVFNAETRAAGYWFLDIDDALQPDGSWSKLAVELCTALAPAAVEVSDSGRGLHIFGRGAVPENHRSKPPAAWGTDIEFYTTGRFVALTGDRAQGDASADVTPALLAVLAKWFPAPAVESLPHGEGPVPEWFGPTDDDELIRRARGSTSARATFGGGASFEDLWTANADALARAFPSPTDTYDRSAADRALAQHLAFWTGKDAARIERIMRRSALVRDKWDRDDYLGPRTIGSAVSQQRDVLKDKRPEPLQSAERAALPDSAPRMSAVTGETFLGPQAQAELFAGCVYVVSQNKVLVPGGRLLAERNFRTKFGGYSFAMDSRNERVVRNAWEAFTESQVLRRPIADDVVFRPDLPYGEMLIEDGQTCVNKYWPVETPSTPGDPSPFLDHLKRMLPNDHDRALLLAYMAAVVQHKGVKFQWAPIIQGVEGNGKTYISRVLAQALGARYVHWPVADKLGKDFNAYLGDRMLICVEDIYLPNSERHILERLKPMIAGGSAFEVEGKGVDQVSVAIVCNWIFNSNHKNGLPKSANDRRIAPFFCAQQTKADLERDGLDGAYFRTLKRWFDGEAGVSGYAIMTHYLQHYAIPPEMNPALGGIAPTTSSTEQAISRSLGSVEQLVQEQIEQGAPGFCGGWLSSMALDRLLDRAGRASIAMSARADIVAALGYEKHPGLPGGRVNNIVLPDGGKPRLYVTVKHPTWTWRDQAAIARAYSEAQAAVEPVVR